MPGVVAYEPDQPTNQRREGDIGGVGGQGGGGGAEISGVECLLLVGFLSQFSGVHRADQTPSGQLECSGAGGGVDGGPVGLMLPPTLMGGWVRAEH